MNGHLLGAAIASCVLGCGGGANEAATPAPPAVPPPPAAPPAPTVCATFYSDANLQGATLVSMGPADSIPIVPGAFNDVMSSVAVTPGCTAIVYADGNYGGQTVTFTQTAQTVPASINDQMSSYKCTCGSAAVK